MEQKAYKVLGGVLLTASAYLLLDALVLEQYYFQVKEFDIGDGKNKNSKIKAILLTDLHLQKLGKSDKKLAKKINSIKPDIIFFAGDSVDKGGKLKVLDHFLKLLDINIQKVSILGNHERLAGLDIDKLKQTYQKYNVDLLINKSKAYYVKDKRIMVTGVDDMVEGCPNFKQAVKDVGREENHVVLIHSPYQQDKIKESLEEINSERQEGEKLNVSYFFAGHNHGGQVNLLGFAPVLPPKAGDYVNGWYNDEKPYLYLSKGFGTSTIPVRFGARSEVTLFNYYLS